jgi:preprotein translocase subunit SecD
MSSLRNAMGSNVFRAVFAAAVMLFATQISTADEAGDLAFRMVHEAPYADDLGGAPPPEGYEVLADWAADEPSLVVSTDILFTHADLVEVKSDLDPATQAPRILIVLNEEASRILAEVTAANISRRIAIVLDGRILSAPVIVSEIPGPELVINGAFDLETVETLVARIRAAMEQDG